MFDYLLGFKDEEERDEFLIALPVLAFFGCMLYYFVFGGDQWVASKWASVTSVEIVGDADSDGIADADDECPALVGVLANQGCPVAEEEAALATAPQDSDKDGVADSKDRCPALSGLAANNGCPAAEPDSDAEVPVDQDGDGVNDAEDECPTEPGDTANGCPVLDSDGDGVADDTDLCPQSAGVAQNKGCPADADGDGLPDDQDQCPREAGNYDNQGCPTVAQVDSDGDGVFDNEDGCPALVGVSANGGCPADADRDGIYDTNDQCPQEVGLLEYDGCAESQEDALDLQDLGSNITFEPASAVLTSESRTLLQAVVRTLKRYPNVNLQIIGHTDSQGEAAINQKLSEQRARACASFLTRSGIDVSRISSEGLGETQPIADNATASGRRQNRRVEFKLTR